MKSTLSTRHQGGEAGITGVLIMMALFFASWLAGQAPLQLSSSRSRRCRVMREDLAHTVQVELERQPSWLAGPDHGRDVARASSSSHEHLREGYPLRRRDMRALQVNGTLKGVPVCPEQGPLTRPDSYHYVAYLRSDGEITLRCRVHHW